ncbi:hypothetical protein SteCoe_38851 [Stentor coeruleus]|uniref:Peptidase C51 domain-containing protein n=1 Tax=Stentor coeruleus TaxID=5963 RepID=A0A1R2AKZ9_9CILI|nr:hypothetical protein SteCoe_38851 [Stentor coeruleus]
MEQPGFGVLLGSYKGVEGYSNRKAKWPGRANYVNGYFTGYKYQCVEYVRRWLIKVKHLLFKDISCAYQIWDLNKVKNILTKSILPLIRIPNGSLIPPIVDALLIYAREPENPTGHVAIISVVDLNNNYIRVAEQNVEDAYWAGDFAREIKLEIVDGRYFIQDKFFVLGWMIYENIENF